MPPHTQTARRRGEPRLHALRIGPVSGSGFSSDDAGLDNPAYAALSSVHSRFVQRRGRALRYPADIMPILAMPSAPSTPDWQDGAWLVAPGTDVLIIHTGTMLPENWKVNRTFDVVQMTGEHAAEADEPEAVRLGTADVPKMQELVRRTNPGPFLDRTIELGTYVGIRRDGVLVAMAGQRLRFPGWTEISAVCTAPSHRGHGMASRLVSVLLASIHARREHAFLHVLTTNVPAIRLYERLGLRARRTLTLAIVTPP